jgi:hypothetical protein
LQRNPTPPLPHHRRAASSESAVGVNNLINLKNDLRYY